MKKVVGMSGGVDSSVAALLLKQQGFDVLGVFMKNWEDPEPHPEYRENQLSGCTWEEDFADVRAVCNQLEIPYTTFNFVEEYKQRVFDTFVEELKAGRTPNPDIMCNQEIKFQLFLEKALKLEGVKAIATGHYAKIENEQLVRPKDRNKDQTYFLYRIDRKVLSQVIFPLQDLTKDEVRKIAQEQGFPNADKKDSTGICFIGNIDYRQFIDQYIPKKPGKIQTSDGHVIGEHNGLHFYTRGQRKGINIGGDGPYYVVAKDLDRNILIVSNDAEDPGLLQKSCIVAQMHWIEDVSFPFECDVQIRYRQQAQPALVTKNEAADGIHIQFIKPQRAITPGQSAVLYMNDRVIGGGIIDSLPTV